MKTNTTVIFVIILILSSIIGLVAWGFSTNWWAPDDEGTSGSPGPAKGPGQSPQPRGTTGQSPQPRGTTGQSPQPRGTTGQSPQPRGTTGQVPTQTPPPPPPFEFPTQTPPPPPFEFPTFFMMVYEADQSKSIHVNNGSTADGTRLVIWNADPMNYNNRWRYNSSTRQIINEGSGKMLEVQNGSSGNGTIVQMWSDRPGDPRQQWTYDPTTKNIMNVMSETVLDLEAGRTTNGTFVQMWSTTNITTPTHQKWIIQSINPINLPTNREFGLMNMSGRNYMNVANSGTSDGTRIQSDISGISNNDNKWRYLSSTKQIVNPRTGKCLDATNDNNEGQLVIWGCDTNNPRQKWNYDPVTKTLKSDQHGDGTCVDLQAGRSGNAVKIQNYGCNDNSAQQWIIDLIP